MNWNEQYFNKYSNQCQVSFQSTYIHKFLVAAQFDYWIQSTSLLKYEGKLLSSKVQARFKPERSWCFAQILEDKSNTEVGVQKNLKKDLLRSSDLFQNWNGFVFIRSKIQLSSGLLVFWTGCSLKWNDFELALVVWYWRTRKAEHGLSLFHHNGSRIYASKKSLFTLDKSLETNRRRRKG